MSPQSFSLQPQLHLAVNEREVLYASVKNGHRSYWYRSLTVFIYSPILKHPPQQEERSWQHCRGETREGQETEGSGTAQGD